MTTLITANLILWLSIYTYFMPLATDKQASNDDIVIIKHKESINQ